MEKKLPIYDAIFKEEDTLLRSEEAGISVISLVEKPAIESDFLKFSEDEEVKKTSILNDEQRIIVGAMLVPDKLIYRNTDKGEFFIRFSESVIKNMHLSMMRNGSFNYFSIAHNGETLPDWKVTPIEIWRKEFEEDKSNAYGFDLPVGTLFMAAKVEDEQLWEKIKANEINGFSIEATLDYQYSNMEKFLFNKIEKGERVAHQTLEGVNFSFSGEFDEGEQKVTVKDGIIEDIKDINEPAKEEPKVEPETEPEKEPKENPAIEALTERFERLESALSKIGEYITKKADEKDETLNATLLKMEEIKLAAQQVDAVPVVKTETVKLEKIDIINKLK